MTLICEPLMSKDGAILSSSSAKGANMAACEVGVGVGAAAVDVEVNLRHDVRVVEGRVRASWLRRVVAHRDELRTNMLSTDWLPKGTYRPLKPANPLAARKRCRRDSSVKDAVPLAAGTPSSYYIIIFGPPSDERASRPTSTSPDDSIPTACPHLNVESDPYRPRRPTCRPSRERSPTFARLASRCAASPPRRPPALASLPTVGNTRANPPRNYRATSTNSSTLATPSTVATSAPTRPATSTSRTSRSCPVRLPTQPNP